MVRFHSLTRRLLRLLVVALPSLTAGLLFVLAALAGAWATAALSGQDTLGGRALLVGAVCGLVAVLFVTVFHIRRETLTLPFHDGLRFRERLYQEARELGYRRTAIDVAEDGAWFRPRFTTLLLGGGLRVRWGKSDVTLTGPRVFLEILRNRLRMHRHVGQIQRSAADSWAREGKTLFKRVEVCLRVLPEHWQDVRDDVLDVLAGDGAAIVCEVHVLAQSEQGIVKNTVDVLRDRLRRKHLVAEVRHEPVRCSSEVPVIQPTQPAAG
jgi:hypothetical protein